jgi:hypothetical protein
MASREHPKSPPTERLLYTRRQVAELLGHVDVSYIRRLEKEGRLKAIRLFRSPTAQVFFSVEQVHALVREAVNG